MKGLTEKLIGRIEEQRIDDYKVPVEFNRVFSENIEDLTVDF